MAGNSVVPVIDRLKNNADQMLTFLDETRPSLGVQDNIFSWFDEYCDRRSRFMQLAAEIGVKPSENAESTKSIELCQVDLNFQRLKCVLEEYPTSGPFIQPPVRKMVENIVREFETQGATLPKVKQRATL